MQTKVLGIVVGLIVVVAVGYGIVSRNNKKTEVASNTVQQDTHTKAEEAMNKDESMMKDEKMAGKDKMAEGEMMAKHGSYLDYSTETVAAEQKAGHKVVLFFHAVWCPFCKAADAAFKAKLDQIPTGITILKTDYDSQAALKQKYGVTYQHTFVQIDASGNQVTKWNGGDIDNLKTNLK